MSKDKLPVFENFPDEDKKLSKLIKWIKYEIYQPIARKINFLLSLINSGSIEIPADDVAPGADGNWRWRVDGINLVLQRKVSGTWTDTAIKFLTTGDSVVHKTSGLGIKVDLQSPTFGFRDLLGEVFARNTGATKPSRAVWKGGLMGFQFGVSDEEEFEYHITHDYVPGTDIFLHVHWGHNGALVTGGTCSFTYEMGYAKGHGQGAFGANVTGTIVSAVAQTNQFSHELSESQVSISGASGTQIDTDNLEPDGVIKVALTLSANNLTVSGGGVPDPFIHYVDIHFQTTGIMGTKDKVPNFYT